MKKVLFLLLLCSCVGYGQTYSTNYHFPYYSDDDTLYAGSTGDTAQYAIQKLNAIPSWLEYYFTKYFSTTKDTLINHYLRLDASGGAGGKILLFDGATPTRAVVLTNQALSSSRSQVFPDNAGTFLVAVTAPLTHSGTTGIVGLDTTDATGTAAATHNDLLAKISTASLDTISKAIGFYAVAANDSAIIFEVPDGVLTLRTIRAIRVAGTTDTLNVTRNRGGSIVDLLTANYAVTTSMASCGTLQNTGLLSGDLIRVSLRGVTGTATEIFVQLVFTKVRI